MSKRDEDYLSEAIEDFKAYREHNRKAKRQMRDYRTKSIYAHIIDLEEQGVEVFKLNDYQYRFVKDNHRIDYFPTSGKYHDITLNKRGNIPAFKISQLFL